VVRGPRLITDFAAVNEALVSAQLTPVSVLSRKLTRCKPLFLLSFRPLCVNVSIFKKKNHI
jgi:hypothetical protein